MGTRWNARLALIDKPTGDGRRMKTGAMRNRALPLPLKWQRADEVGHFESVIVGSIDDLNIDDAKGEVMGAGEFFDGEPGLSPRLLADVAEAMLLASKGVIGPSVDAGAAQAIFVRAGTDEPLTEEDWDDIWEEAEESGEDPQIELLFTDYEIAGATLVGIPAFGDLGPFNVETTQAPAEGDDEEAPVAAAAAVMAPAMAAARQQLVLTAAAGPMQVPADVFTGPAEAPEYQLLTVHPQQPGEHFRRVSGYAAAFDSCHLQYREVCVTPPPSSTDYAMFHRHLPDGFDVVPAEEGAQVPALGRITTGHGKAGTGCSHRDCRGKDDHACDFATMSAALAHYDALTAVAWVRATEYETGVWVQGIVDPDATDRDLAVLARQKVSGDWRDHGGHLEMIEVLALATGRPGFPIPVPSVAMANGRQMSLTAAMSLPSPGRRDRTQPGPVDYKRMAGAVVDEMAARGLVVGHSASAGGEAPTEGVTAAAGTPTGAMIALRMSDADAEALAVEGGERVEELHLTLGFLGQAADIPEETQRLIVDEMSAYLADRREQTGEPVTGETFAVSAFNATSDERQTAIVLSLNGPALAAVHDGVMERLATVFTAPEQHQPWAAHVTLIYSDDLSLVERLADRSGQPMTFDRLRIAFGGEVTDLSFANEELPTHEDAGALAAQVEAVFADMDTEARVAEAQALVREIEEGAESVRVLG